MNYIRILRMHIKGFMPIGDMAIDFQDKGIISVIGKNKFDGFSDSNGSGKSAIFEALLWGLQAETVRGIDKDDIINENWEGYAEVEIDFEYNEVEYKIIRRRNHPDLNNTVTFIRDGEDKTGNTMTKTNKIIDDEFGFLTSELLKSIVILGQGLPSKFSSLKPSSRKSRIEELSQSSKIISDLKSKLSDLNNDKVSQIQATHLEGAKYGSKIESIESDISDWEDEIEEIQDNDDYLSDEVKKKLNDKLDNLEELEDKLSDQLSPLNTKINKVNSRSKTISNKIRSFNKEIKSEKSDMSKLETSKCYTCGTVLKSEEQVNKLKDEKLEKISKLKDKVAILEGKLDSTEDNLSSLKDKKEIITNKITSCKSSMRDIRSQLRDADDVSSVSVSYLNEQIDDSNDKLDEYNKKYEEYEQKIESLNEEKDIINYVKSQVSRDFRGYLLEGTVEYLNYRLSEYSKILYKGDSFVEMRIDGNDLDIIFDDRVYEKLSGGEKRRVDIAVQFSLRDLSRSEAGIGFNILVLDEIFDNLDESGINKTIELINTMLSDVESVYQISHRSDLYVPSDDTLVIEKGKDEISRLV